MSAWGYAALLAIPLAAAALRRVRPWFALNAIVSLSCAAIVLAVRGAVSPLFFGLIVSVAADWFMAHKAGRTGWYLCGIGGFSRRTRCFCGTCSWMLRSRRCRFSRSRCWQPVMACTSHGAFCRA